jgi:hypothetical protein
MYYVCYISQQSSSTFLLLVDFSEKTKKTLNYINVRYNKLFHPAIVWFYILIKGVIKNYLVIDLIQFFWPDSCSATVRNGNSIGADTIEDTTEDD